MGAAALSLVHAATVAAMRALALPDAGSLASLGVFLVGMLALARVSSPVAARVAEGLASAERVLIGNLGLFVMPLLLARSRMFLATPPGVLARVAAASVAGYGLTLLGSALLALPLRGSIAPAPATGPAAAGRVPWAFLAAALVSFALRGHGALWQRLFELSVMLAAWGLGLCVPLRWRPVLNPLVAASALALGAFGAAGVATAGLFPGGGRVGAGDALLALLAPSVVALALGLFRRRAWLWAHGRALAVSITASVASGLVATACVLRVAGVPGEWARAMLTRSVTTPIAVMLAPKLGADPSLAASIVLLTGVLAAATARPLLTVCGALDPVVRAVAVASSGHALGTATLSAHEPEAAGVATLTFTLYALATAAVLGVPWVRAALLALALG